MSRWRAFDHWLAVTYIVHLNLNSNGRSLAEKMRAPCITCTWIKHTAKLYTTNTNAYAVVSIVQIYTYYTDTWSILLASHKICKSIYVDILKYTACRVDFIFMNRISSGNSLVIYLDVIFTMLWYVAAINIYFLKAWC